MISRRPRCPAMAATMDSSKLPCRRKSNSAPTGRRRKIRHSAPDSKAAVATETLADEPPSPPISTSPSDSWFACSDARNSEADAIDDFRRVTGTMFNSDVYRREDYQAKTPPATRRCPSTPRSPRCDKRAVDERTIVALDTARRRRNRGHPLVHTGRCVNLRGRDTKARGAC